MKLVILFIFLLQPITDAYAFIPDQKLADPQQEKRAKELFKEIRCVVCVGQSVADSEVELAKNVRALIRKQIADGYSNQEIKDFLVIRYGNQILFRPKFDNSTYFLWFTPFIFLLIGVAILALYTQRKKKS